MAMSKRQKQTTKCSLALLSLLFVGTSLEANVKDTLKEAFPPFSGENCTTLKGIAQTVLLDLLLPARCIQQVTEALDYVPLLRDGINAVGATLRKVPGVSSVLPENTADFAYKHIGVIGGLEVSDAAHRLLVTSYNPSTYFRVTRMLLTGASAHEVERKALPYVPVVGQKIADVLYPKADANTTVRRSLVYQLALRGIVQRAMQGSSNKSIYLPASDSGSNPGTPLNSNSSSTATSSTTTPSGGSGTGQ